VNAIIDTGVLVALVNAKDKHHGWAISVVNGYKALFVTSEAVLTEAQFLISRLKQAPVFVSNFVEVGFLTVASIFDERAAAASMFFNKYRNVPMSLADAGLVLLSERFRKHDVLTLDSDFYVYLTEASCRWFVRGELSFVGFKTVFHERKSLTGRCRCWWAKDCFAERALRH
jgi:uncharacterized protein